MNNAEKQVMAIFKPMSMMKEGEYFMVDTELGRFMIHKTVSYKPKF